MSARYGGEVKWLVFHRHRVSTRIPTMEEMERIKRGDTDGFAAQEVIDLLLNYIQNLEQIMEEKLY